MKNLLKYIFPKENPAKIKEEYNIPDILNYKFSMSDKGIVATCNELPGFITNADNPKELLEMINDAVLEYFNVPKHKADYVFNQLNIDGIGTVTLEQKEQYA
ncbi:MAG: hypothetical protein COU22_03110 [Candidatus Komeilibacteria bacterium CG10_big_fil_rev_8_21_14_0_10_41_13]|uniref:Uncharacterized protein n=1 Tax=Candidatus Komeilibacteria bacterium CG10_big_fil_rev_8_21_14_0_10_41_13 TaxID=1974476 RepID=A0A2M6WBV8_9BACT|nr:MAG: hypothetical protein COU22_03110 [Candidatus Komeilibacteria bacterium CG10_big_fil_rev_8_21_14_0_10_41_13]